MQSPAARAPPDRPRFDDAVPFRERRRMSRRPWASSTLGELPKRLMNRCSPSGSIVSLTSSQARLSGDGCAGPEWTHDTASPVDGEVGEARLS